MGVLVKVFRRLTRLRLRARARQLGKLEKRDAELAADDLFSLRRHVYAVSYVGPARLSYAQPMSSAVTARYLSPLVGATQARARSKTR
jgi:hypothetical protein